MWPWHRNEAQMRKIRFWVCCIFSVVLYQESLCKNCMALSKVLFEIWPFIYKPHYKLRFFSIDFSFLLLVFHIVAYHTLRSTTFLLFELGYSYLACIFINLFEFTVHGIFVPVTLTVDPNVKLLTVIWKYCVLFIIVLSLGSDFKFLVLG